MSDIVEFSIRDMYPSISLELRHWEHFRDFALESANWYRTNGPKTEWMDRHIDRWRATAVLAGSELLQMEKRAAAANKRADALEARLKPKYTLDELLAMGSMEAPD